LELDAESPESVIVLVFGRVVEPKAIFAGLKEQVPDTQDRATVSVKVMGAERDIVKVVVVVPMG
jgi:succinyl-CoA synthetase beta subunit